MNRWANCFLVAACAGWSSAGQLEPGPASTGPADWLEWRSKRLESVAGTNGWTTLVGLHWLREGTNYAGSAPTNHAVLPPGRAAETVGLFVRQGGTVRFEAAPGVASRVDGQTIRRAILRSDADGEPTRLHIDGLSIVVIARGDRLGLRVRDPQAPARLHFGGLKSYPYQPAWRIPGRFEAAPRPRKLRVPDVIGGLQEFNSPGTLVFFQDGREFRLDVAVEEGEDDYFVLFHDLTAGETTYPSGRFLYVPKPDPAGRVTLDFNRAYTPPCGFTEYATCPLPPRQNWMPFAIPAGELKPPGH